MAEVTTYWTQDLEKLRWNKPGGLIPETLTLIVLEGTMQISVGEKPSIFSLTCKACKRNEWVVRVSPWYNTSIFILEVTDSYLIGCKACLIWENLRLYYKRSPLPVTEEAKESVL